MAKNWEKCPKCGSENLDGSLGEVYTGKELYWETWCEKCGFAWSEVFKFSHNTTPETPYETLDDEGNILKPLDK